MRMPLVLLAGVVATTLDAQPVSPPTNYVITLTPDEAQLLLVKLGAAPWNEVNTVMTKILTQIKSQQSPPTLPSPAPEIK